MPQETAQTNESVVEKTIESPAIAEKQDKEVDEESAEVNEEKFEDEGAEESSKQSKEENAKFAKERREREKARKEKQEQELESKRQQELEKVRFEATKKALGGVNPYTKAKLEDDYDLQEYFTMKEMEEKGLDPIQDYSKYIKESRRNQDKQQTLEAEKKSKEEWIAKDRDEFADKYPDVDLNELVKDEMFKKFAYGKVGNVSMAQIYEGYLDMKSEIDKEVKKQTARLVANQKSSPGALKDNSEVEPSWTIDDIKKMSPEEVHKNYDKIMKILSKKGGA